MPGHGWQWWNIDYHGKTEETQEELCSNDISSP
jgi:hypothetical protein